MTAASGFISAQSRFITRGATEGELYLSTPWYCNYDFEEDTLHKAILHITENGKKAEINHAVMQELPSTLIADKLPMQIEHIMADATPGVLYNVDWFMDNQAYDHTRLWFSEDYGKTWELRDTPVYRSGYFAANAEGLNYRGGGEVFCSENSAEEFVKIKDTKYVGHESGLQKEEFFSVGANEAYKGKLGYTDNFYKTYIEIPIDPEYMYGPVSGIFPDVFRGGKPGEVYIDSRFPDYSYKVSFSVDTGYHFRIVHQRERPPYAFMTDRKAGDFYIVIVRVIETQAPYGWYTIVCIEHYTDYGEKLVDTYCHELTREGVITAIGETETFHQITVHPNPTTGKIQVTGDRLQVTHIEVFDLLGKRVLEQHAEGCTQYEIDMSNLPAGIYFVRIQTEKGVITRKIIKQ